MSKTNKEKMQKLEFLYGKENAPKSMYQVIEHIYGGTITYCNFCNAPLTHNEVNDYGTICEKCYMKKFKKTNK